MSVKLLVNCKDYNGRENVLFMMKPDDSRLPGGAWYRGDYEIVAEGKYHTKRLGVAGGVTLDYGQIGLLEADGRRFVVYSDWSLKELEG